MSHFSRSPFGDSAVLIFFPFFFLFFSFLYFCFAHRLCLDRRASRCSGGTKKTGYYRVVYYLPNTESIVILQKELTPTVQYML